MSRPYGQGVRTTHDEREARLVLVENMRFKRLLSWETISRELALEFGCTQRNVRRYIKTVRDRAKLRAQADPDPSVTRDSLTEAAIDVMNEARNRTRLVDGRTVADPDSRTALRAIQVLADLHGLRVTRHEITGAGGVPLAMSGEDAAKALRAAIERAVARSEGGDGEG